MNIYLLGISIGLLVGIVIAAFYCLICEFLKSDDQIIDDWRRG